MERIAIAIFATALLTSCSMSGPWRIDVVDPRGNDWTICADRDEVEETFVAASLPPTGASIRLKDGVPLAVANEIAECVRARLGDGSGGVTVSELSLG